MFNSYVMNSVSIAVISVNETNSDDGTIKKRREENELSPKYICRVLCPLLLGIVAFCVILEYCCITGHNLELVVLTRSFFELRLVQRGLYLRSGLRLF